MPRISKKIVSAGVYRLANGKFTTITPERLAHWVSEFNRYSAAGNLLPAPWSHVDPTTKQPIVMGPHLERSDLNAGFWHNLRIENDPKLGPTLTGDVEVPGDIQDPNTPAGKIGTTVRETSIYVAPTFTDGKSNAYADVPLHIALVTHPIQPGQPNFETNVGAIAMSQLAFTMAAVPPSGGEPKAAGNDAPAGDKGAPPQKDGQQPGAAPQNASNPSIQTVIQSLKQCGVVLPNDTNDQNFLERLMVALGQKAASDTDSDGNVFEQPEGAETKSPAPVAMSQTITAADFANIPREVFMAHPVAKEILEANQILIGALQAQAKATRRAKIDSLLAQRPDLADYVKTHLEPMFDSFQMSMEPNAPKAGLDIALEVLEKMPAPPTPAKARIPSSLLGNSALAMSAGADPLMGELPLDFDAEKLAQRLVAAAG